MLFLTAGEIWAHTLERVWRRAFLCWLRQQRRSYIIPVPVRGKHLALRHGKRSYRTRYTLDIYPSRIKFFARNRLFDRNLDDDFFHRPRLTHRMARRVSIAGKKDGQLLAAQFHKD